MFPSLKFLSLVTITLLISIFPLVQLESRESSHISNAISRRSRPSNSPTKPSCAGCLRNEIESQLPKDTLRSLRLQLIKDQILRKLGLREIPKSEDVILPSPVIAMGDSIRTHHNSQKQDFDDFYGKTEQIVVLGESVDCSSSSSSSASISELCFSFDFGSVRSAAEVGRVEFWGFKLSGEGDLELHDDSNGDEGDSLGSIPMLGDYYGWMNASLSPQVLLKTKSMRILVKNADLGTEGDQRPFMLFHMDQGGKKRRNRRHAINCSPGVSECCRERFVVNFKEMGLNFIIAPESYETFFCKGKCNGANGLSSSASRRTTFVLKQLEALGRRGNETDMLGVIPCCSPTQMKSIDLIYRENNTIKYETVPNMVIESCGCM